MFGVELAEPVDRWTDRLGCEVWRDHPVERGPELRRDLLDGERHPELRPEGVQRRADPGAGVDQGHVEVEPDRQQRGHGLSLETPAQARDSGLPLLGLAR